MTAFTPPPSAQIAGPRALTLCMVVVLAAWHVFYLPVGSLWHVDEFLTLDRAAGFARHGDWLTVYSNNLPGFNKPPLQYWMSAGLMALDLDLETAVRLPSFLFALGTLAATAWLARLVMPLEPWAMPVAVLLVACSTRFWLFSISGLLDIGSTFFATVALAATFQAVRQPRWWWVVALACGLGALQKTPAPLLFSAVPLVTLALTRRWTGLPVGPGLRSGHFAGAALVTLCLVTIWPLLQWLRHGAGSLETAYVEQMIQRFSPVAAPNPLNGRSLWSILMDGEPFPRVLGYLAVLWLPFARARRVFLALPVMIGAYALVSGLANGFVSPRYSVMFLPIIMVALTAAIFALLRSWPIRLVAVTVLAMSGPGPFKTEGRLNLDGEGVARYLPLMHEVAAQVRPGERLISCGPVRGPLRLPTGALSYHASAGTPWTVLRAAEDIATLEAGSARLRGLCSRAQYDAIAPSLDGARIVSEFEGNVHWTASGPRPRP